MYVDILYFYLFIIINNYHEETKNNNFFHLINNTSYFSVTFIVVQRLNTCRKYFFVPADTFLFCK